MQGDAAVAEQFCRLPFDALLFTGSTAIGRRVMAAAAENLTPLTLELGGKSPVVIAPDFDLKLAARRIVFGELLNAGQTCVCTNRFYVQEGVYDEFVTKFAAKVQTAKVGNGFDDGVNQGPLIEDAAVAKVQKHLDDAVSKGGRVVTGGHQLKKLGSGQFFEPTVLADASPDMLLARQETFGPLAPVFKFKTEQEAIAAANATEFGLASYFYTRDVGRIFRVGEALEYGMVGVNVGILATEHVPFGGVKQSGIGREGSHHGMDDYVEIKYMCIGDVQK
ncbi:Glutarate-semialdehyde dehydrogenase DavD [bioreactor metagenome]|uniref:Glutarate-semialdehyde dehydrogenase DavD n=1 Tax=bioreactor metagenome TaxID=1076179 RepID=A0A645EWU6_9ZZZZ